MTILLLYIFIFLFVLIIQYIWRNYKQIVKTILNCDYIWCLYLKFLCQQPYHYEKEINLMINKKRKVNHKYLVRLIRRLIDIGHNTTVSNRIQEIIEILIIKFHIDVNYKENNEYVLVKDLLKEKNLKFEKEILSFYLQNGLDKHYVAHQVIKRDYLSLFIEMDELYDVTYIFQLALKHQSFRIIEHLMLENEDMADKIKCGLYNYDKTHLSCILKLYQQKVKELHKQLALTELGTEYLQAQQHFYEKLKIKNK